MLVVRQLAVDLFEPLPVPRHVAGQLGGQCFQRSQHLTIDVLLPIQGRKSDQQIVGIGEMVVDFVVLGDQQSVDVAELVTHEPVCRNNRVGGIGNDRRLCAGGFAQLRFDSLDALDVLRDTRSHRLGRRVQTG